MIKIFKSNKIITIFLFIICLIIIFNPTIYGKSCLNAISVWAFKVMPLMFPFFILTKLISNLNPPKSSYMDKFFNKIYHTPNGSFLTFALSVLSGYPMGAKLIGDMFSNKYINADEAKTMLSFCSVSGPMFMIGTVGVMMFYSYSAGLIILISNILASLINGLIYRGKPNSIELKPNLSLKNKTNLSDCVHDSLISILMVGSYIVLSFIVIDILENLNIINYLSKSICCVFNNYSSIDVVKSFLKGTIEITRGIFDLSNTNVSLSVKTILASGLIGFGGISILLQSLNFLKHINISTKRILIQKLTQGIISLVIAIPFAIIFI